MNVLELLGKRVLLLDGAMGTMLQALGVPPGVQPALWSLTRPELVMQVHDQYLRAGSDILSTNTFGANRLLLPEGTSVAAVVEAAVAVARQAVQRHEKGAFVALNIGPSGRLLEPYGDLPFEEAVQLFGDVVRAGARAGADLVLIETMSDSLELKAAVLAAKEYSDLPVMASMTFHETAKLLTGADVRGMVAMLEGLGVAALGCNCGLGPAQMRPVVRELLDCASVPVLVNPNAGLPEMVDGKASFAMEPRAFAQETAALVEMGVWLAGGCCGTTPEHIRQLTALCDGIVPKPIATKGNCVVSSWGQSVALGKGTVAIGERLNPTGKKRLKQALREKDVDYLLREALRQQQEGAQILDVNLGLPELDEAALFRELLPRLQAVTDLPLQVDTSNPVAMEAALRVYNGKPLINSVCGKPESMATIFPLVKKYGGVVVALTLDDNGIPETVEGRLAIARTLVQEAARYGIAPKDILVDALTLPVATRLDAASVTLDTLRRAKAELGVGTILGVSNISHGLPNREALNATFLTMAVAAGLDAAILNTGAEVMMQALGAARALLGLDAGFAGYLAAVGSAPDTREKRTEGTVPTLGEAVWGGMAQSAAEAVLALLREHSAEEVLTEHLLPALDAVTGAYEKGRVFLPQLLQSTEASRAAFDALGKRTSNRTAPAIVLATVAGDVHDIGKNIVKVLLENYGYGVVDLGKNVPHERIVEEARANKARLIGLSALMTTTVPSMEQAIAVIRRELPQTHVMVGGAVLTSALARHIGADSYGRDAMAGVAIAKKVLGEAR